LVAFRRAVEVALDPASPPKEKSEAHSNLEALKLNACGWKLCLELLCSDLCTNDGTLNAQVAFVCLQMIEYAILSSIAPKQRSIAANFSLFPEDLNILRSSFLKIVFGAYEMGTKSNSVTDAPFFKNKLAQIITLLFVAQYPALWPSFFDDISALVPPQLRGNPTPGENQNLALSPALDPASATSAGRGVDFFLRMCLSIDQEIVNKLINRDEEAVSRNTLLV
jgi:exportin-T